VSGERGQAVSQENVEIIEAAYEALNAGEPDFSVFHSALVYHPRADEPDPSPHIGREAYERLAGDSWRRFPS
jgi:hypothetical protein